MTPFNRKILIFQMNLFNQRLKQVNDNNPHLIFLFINLSSRTLALLHKKISGFKRMSHFDFVQFYIFSSKYSSYFKLIFWSNILRIEVLRFGSFSDYTVCENYSTIYMDLGPLTDRSWLFEKCGIRAFDRFIHPKYDQWNGPILQYRVLIGW